MTLVVARKYQSQICIVSDTKLTYPDEDIKSHKQDPAEGIIKSIILSANACISFSGDIEPAEEAFKKIDPVDSIETIRQKLMDANLSSGFKTDFIICTGAPDLLIIEIKNGQSFDKENAWLGDSAAFNKFQEYFLNDKPNKIDKTTEIKNPVEPHFEKSDQPSITFGEFNLNASTAMLKPFEQMSSAMDLTIGDRDIPSVGGFKVCVLYISQFEFNRYVQTYRGPFSFSGFGSQIITHGTSQEGAYTLNFIGNSIDYNSVALHIKQGLFGIIYNREHGGLLRPKIIKGTEVEFIDIAQNEYNIVAGLITEDRAGYYNNTGISAVNDRQFKKAIEWFDKAVNNTKNDKEKAKYLMHRGYTEWFDGNGPKAILSFNEAQKLDGTLFSAAMNFIQWQQLNSKKRKT